MTYPFDVILASASPRRHEILTQAGIAHRILTAPADERAVPFPEGDPHGYVMALARLKNDAVWEAYPDECEGAAVLSADTVVWSPSLGAPLGKPKDTDDAERMLRALSGTSHLVVTGVELRYARDGRVRGSLFAEETEVFFRPLGRDEIARYVQSGDPMDKAGAYGIQSGACAFVRGIRGDYFNVVGLPVCRVVEELNRTADRILTQSS